MKTVQSLGNQSYSKFLSFMAGLETVIHTVAIGNVNSFIQEYSQGIHSLAKLTHNY